MRKLMKGLLVFALAIATGIFVFAAGRLAQFCLEYKEGEDTYERLQEYIHEPDSGREDPAAIGSEPENTESHSFQIDFEGLRRENPDIVAWIHMPALDVSYPVVQGKDNSYYLTHMANRQENKSGSIFVDCHNQPDFSDSNTIVYGHNMDDGSMFSSLERYQDPELYQQQPYFYIYTPDSVLTYELLSCYAGRTGSAGYTYQFPDPADFQGFLDAVKSYGSYETGVAATTEDRIVTLSTCVNTKRNYRYLLHGRLVQEMKGEQ